MVKQRLFTKYVGLVSKGIYVTDLEVEQGVNNANSLSNIAYILKEYSQIPDSTVTVPESDVRKYYKEHERMFRQSASRDIEYVVFDVRLRRTIMRRRENGERDGRRVRCG